MFSRARVDRLLIHQDKVLFEDSRERKGAAGEGTTVYSCCNNRPKTASPAPSVKSDQSMDPPHNF